MSAIAGLFLRDAQADPLVLGQMIGAIAARGPDGSALWHDGRVGLGHGLLRTASEDEPLPLRQEQLAITADARLDNRANLAAAVGLEHGALAATSDARLILRAYCKWGEQCPQYLLGDFAFVLWDNRRQILFGARDHFGVKPLYFYDGHSGFFFASELKGLFVVPGVVPRVDEIRLADLLARNLDDPSATLFQDIRRLPARHSFALKANGGLSVEEYWRLERPNELHLASDAEYADRFRELFVAAVQSRLGSSRPVGAMLSGGLDSSSIVAIARKREHQDPLHTFSHVFDRTPKYSERLFIERVLAQGGVQPHLVAADDHAPFEDIGAILRHQDEVFIAPGLTRTYSLYEKAAASGVRALLDGHGGDEVVSQGFAYLHELALGGHWVKLWREVRGVSQIYGESALGDFLYYVRLYGLARARSRHHLLDKAWRVPGRLRWSRLRGQAGNDRAGTMTWRHFLADDFMRRSGALERKQHALQRHAEALRSERTEHFWAVSSGMQSRSLEILDRAAGAAGVEPRYPFCDKRLVEFCLALPPEQKLRHGWGRFILRRAMDGLLPPEIQWRRDKLDFTPHLIAGMLTHHRALVDQVLSRDVAGIGRYMNLVNLRQAYARLESGGPRTSGPEALAVWLAVVLAVWLQQLDEPPSARTLSRLELAAAGG